MAAKPAGRAGVKRKRPPRHNLEGTRNKVRASGANAPSDRLSADGLFSVDNLAQAR